MEPYSTWQQVAGYFDGDGTIGFSDLSNMPYKISMSLVFTDQSVDQIRNIKEFLNIHGIRTSNILNTSKGAARIVVVSEYNSVKKALKSMLPFLYKKANEAVAALDYYEDRITGNQLFEIFQREVEAGRRERRPHRVQMDVPFTRKEGLTRMNERRRANLRDAFGRFRTKVTQEGFVTIREEHFSLGIDLTDLIDRCPQYSKETIRRVLGRVGATSASRVSAWSTQQTLP